MPVNRWILPIVTGSLGERPAQVLERSPSIFVLQQSLGDAKSAILSLRDFLGKDQGDFFVLIDNFLPSCVAAPVEEAS